METRNVPPTDPPQRPDETRPPWATARERTPLWKRPEVVLPALTALVLLIPLLTGAAAYRTCGFEG